LGEESGCVGVGAGAVVVGLGGGGIWWNGLKVVARRFRSLSTVVVLRKRLPRGVFGVALSVVGVDVTC